MHPRGIEIVLRGLTRRDAGRYHDHLLRLPPDDRRARFQGAVTERTIDAHAERLDWDRALVFGALVDDILRGVGELLPGLGEAPAELAISVEPDYQHASIGRLLLAASLTAARLARLTEIRMTFLRDNSGMRALAQAAGAELRAGDGIIEGTLHLRGAAGR